MKATKDMWTLDLYFLLCEQISSFDINLALGLLVWIVSTFTVEISQNCNINIASEVVTYTCKKNLWYSVLIVLSYNTYTCNMNLI